MQNLIENFQSNHSRKKIQKIEFKFEFDWRAFRCKALLNEISMKSFLAKLHIKLACLFHKNMKIKVKKLVMFERWSFIHVFSLHLIFMLQEYKNWNFYDLCHKFIGNKIFMEYPSNLIFFCFYMQIKQNTWHKFRIFQMIFHFMCKVLHYFLWK